MQSTNPVSSEEKDLSSMTETEILSSEELVQHLVKLDPSSAAEYLDAQDTNNAEVLGHCLNALKSLGPKAAGSILELLSETTKTRFKTALPVNLTEQWALNETFPEDSIGRMMEPTLAIFGPEMSVRETIERLRELVKREFITYGYVVDTNNRLIGVIVMRDLLFATPDSSLNDIMLKNPFSLKANQSLMEAMREVLTMHFPVYPVSDENGKFVGLVRGHRLFEAQAIEISAQAGSMVGVEKEEKPSTHWSRSFKYRHPWLQLNLVTAFVAGGVVSFFQNTINEIVILAAFLPVLAGQSGNTGCQALAVTLRGMTLQGFKKSDIRKLLIKESFLGFLNGVFVGLSAATGMYVLAKSQGNQLAPLLSLIVLIAMIGSCVISGLAGSLIPVTLKKLGADPATASSIFLTTATDVVSMGLLLSLATWLLL